MWEDEALGRLSDFFFFLIKVTDSVNRGARTYTWDFLLQVQCVFLLYYVIPMNGSTLSIQRVFKGPLGKVFSV